MNGMMKYGNVPNSPACSTGTMFGCCSPAASMISRLNRSAEMVAVTLGREQLDDDAPAEPLVACDEHARHAAAAELALEDVLVGEVGLEVGEEVGHGRIGAVRKATTAYARNAYRQRIRGVSFTLRTNGSSP